MQLRRAGGFWSVLHVRRKDVFHLAISPWCYDELMLACNRQMDIWFLNLDDSMVVPQHARQLNALSVTSAYDIVAIADELLANYQRQDG